jgi:formylglycine-generating enzyme required for sulfatase activity
MTTMCLFCSTAPALATGQAPQIEMVRVDGSCFRMGDTFRQKQADDDIEVHNVCLDTFQIGKYEVTQWQWEAVMGSNPADNKACGADCPVENVNWEEVQTFISRLNRQTGIMYRLPTEAEWEYAARGGGKGERFAGTNMEERLGEYAWIGSNSAGMTHVVGTRKPNGLGLFDMNGNVYEWCSDWYEEKYYERSPRENPQGPVSGLARIYRGGGSWGNDPRQEWVTARYGVGPEYRGGIGFRLAVSLKAPPTSQEKSHQGHKE